MLRRIGLVPFALLVAGAGACRERPVIVVGEPETIDHSEVHVLPRSSNGRDYRITVGVPDSYVTEPNRRSGFSAHASRRMKPAVDNFKQDCKVSTSGLTTLSDSRSGANSGIRRVSLAPSC